VATLASCSTSYKAQTPDDVYFSPPKGNGATTTKTETQPTQQAATSEYYPAQDSYLRWKVRDPQRWSTFDDYDYQWYAYNNPAVTYGYYGYQPWGVYWNSYWTWNSYYNPYCNKVIVVNPKTNTTAFNKIRTYTPGTYNNTTYNNSNRGTKTVKLSNGAYSPNRTYNNNNNSLGSTLKKMFSNSGTSYSPNNSSSSSSDRPVRSYSPSSSGSSSSGSSGGSRSSGGGGGVSRPGRGG